MSGKPDSDEQRPESPEAPEAPESPEAPETAEGWEGLSEEASAGSLEPSAELEAALQEASDAVEARADTRRPSSSSADKLVLEALSNELQSLKEEYEVRVAELDEIKDKHVRLQAEFENFRRRGLKERQEAHTYGHQNLVKDLLSTVDNLDRAIEHAALADKADKAGEGGDLQGLLRGVELVRREFLAVLDKYGVSEIATETTPEAGDDGDDEKEGTEAETGERRPGIFDPALHEAMAQVPDDTVPANTIVQVLQKGYQLRDRMLRPARVIVAREPTDDERENEPS